MSQGKKRALIVVDVQNDFCPGGALTVPGGDEVTEPLNRLIEDFLKRGDPVIKTRDWHPPETRHFADFGGRWPVHCVRETPGAAFHSALLDDPRIIVVSKGTGHEDGYSGFDGTNLVFLLRQQSVEEVWIGGLATDYCVKHTALDAVHAGFDVTVDTSAIRGVEVDPGDSERALDELRAAGASVTSPRAARRT